MATGTIEKTVIEGGGLTALITPSRADIAQYSRAGNVCTIAFNNVSFSSSYSSDTYVYKCPYHPGVQTRFMMYTGTAGDSVACFIYPDSKISIARYTAGRLLYGHCTFVIS